MIVSVSRRTDIPAFYSEWFAQRLKEGYALIRNPYNRKQLSRVLLTRDIVDCFVFWTKDPAPLMERISILEGYNFYFQVTITPYSKDIEPFVRDTDAIIRCLSELSETIGAHRVIWRYDPILLNAVYTKDYHYKMFNEMSRKLKGVTNKCIISFIDDYKEVRRNAGVLGLKNITDEDMREMAAHLSSIAKTHGMVIESCSEKADLSAFGINHASCIDARFTGKTYKPDNIRADCGCVKSVDIGDYNTCPHKCAYCYANYNASEIEKNRSASGIDSPLLTGNIKGDEKITTHYLCKGF